MYNERVGKGLLKEDAHQRKIVEGPLQTMYDELQGYTQQVQPETKKAAGGLVSGLPCTNIGVVCTERLTLSPPSLPISTRTSQLSRWFGQKKEEPDALPIPPHIPKGLYLYGDVGTGKS